MAPAILARLRTWPYATAMDAAELEARLGIFLARELEVATVTVRGLRKLAGGASREIWAFELVDGRDGVRRLVLRADPGRSSMEQGGRGQEFCVLRAAHAAGVPVPAVHWISDDRNVLGAPFFIMDHVAGETLARRLLRDPEYAEARAVMAAQLGSILARIHAIDPDAHRLDLPTTRDDVSPAAAEVERYDQLYRQLAPEPHPVIELALRWVATRVPAATRRTLVHGDYRIGNVIFGPEGVRAILDWELAHRGDPMEDLGWMCVKAWRFGSRLPVGGVGDRETLFRAYEDGGGGNVDPTAVHWWEVFGNLKWAVICIGQAQTHLGGGVPSVELASLGRRTAEVEHELLQLIG